MSGAGSLAALGIVYGDIGTSPLYAMRVSLDGAGHELVVSTANVLGVLSLVFWALVVIVSIKYLGFVMRADNHGEGGILALTALVSPERNRARTARRGLILIGLFGTALLYGDGMITPAILVLAAVEGTSVATSALETLVTPLAVAILIGLFAVQRRGTATIGSIFGPVMLVWFTTLTVLGMVQLVGESPASTSRRSTLAASRWKCSTVQTRVAGPSSILLDPTTGQTAVEVLDARDVGGGAGLPGDP